MLKKGDVIDGAYEIVGEIGQGGVGLIYKAIHLRLKKYVVIKQIKSQYVDRIDIRREADILKNLHHSYLPLVYDFLQLDGAVYTIIDFIPGKSLKEYIDGGYRFSQGEIVKWAAQLCEVLDYLHTRRPPVIHRDIKPANIMVTSEGNICLIDFNISLDDISGVITGMSDSYAAPEMYSKWMLYKEHLPHEHIKLDGRSDIYSLGLTLYHMMTGKKPVSNPQPQVPLESFDLPYSEILIFIVNKAMMLNPDTRYQSAAAMLKALRNIKRSEPAYKRLKFFNRITILVCLSIFLAGGILTMYGVKTLQAERLQSYMALVQDGRDAGKDGSFEQALQCFESARELLSDAVDAYYEELLLYSQTAQFERCTEYGQYILSLPALQTSLEQNPHRCADIYFIIANGYFEMEIYETALKYYDEAIKLNDNPEYYRDYAIANARLGHVTEARDLLEKAIALHLTEDYIYLVKAEIALAENNNDDAILCFDKSLELTEDAYLRHRVYILSARAYREAGNIHKEIERLEEGRRMSEAAYLNPILRALGEAYAREALQGGAEADDLTVKALECYTALINANAATFNDCINTVTLYQMQKAYPEAIDLLEQLKTKYPDNYKIYMKLALIYCDMESEKANDDRSYVMVKDYYTRAQTLYAPEKNKGISDSEMQNLENIMEQLYEQKWLER